MNHQTLTVPQVIPQVAYQSPQAPTQLMTKTPCVDSGFAVPVFSPGDDPIACLNKAMAFLTAVASSREDKGKIILVLLIRTMLQFQREILQRGREELLNATTAKVKDIWLGNALSLSDQGMLHDPGILASQAQTVIPHNAAFHTDDLDTYDSDCDDLSNAQAVLMANISNYGSDVILELWIFTDNEISSDSNIIPYSQYLPETQHATVQDTNLQAQQDSMILSVIEQIIKESLIPNKKYKAIPPPYIGNFMPPTPDLSFTGLDEFVNKPVVENRKSNEEVSNIVRKNDDAPIIEEWVSDSEEENVSQPKTEKKTVKPSIAKIEFVKPKQQEKTARKTVKQA
ncbi:hypothetical protein Tco_1084329 [Tanacetum coccineum]